MLSSLLLTCFPVVVAILAVVVICFLCRCLVLFWLGLLVGVVVALGVVDLGGPCFMLLVLSFVVVVFDLLSPSLLLCLLSSV